MPELAAISRLEREPARRGIGAARARALQVLAEHALGVLDAAVRAGEHVADSAAARQADVPDPAGGLRRGNGVRGDGRAFIRIGHLHREGRVVEQHALL